MARRTPVLICCSPHSRAGVTTTARLLTDYNLVRGVAAAGFDTDPHEPRYADLFPQLARVVDIADIKGQIALFDQLLLHDDIPRVVDVWHRSYDRFFATVRDIGFFEEADRIGVEPIVFFHADGAEHTLERALALDAQWPGLRMMIVHNEGAAPLNRNPLETLSRYPSRGKIIIPALEGPVARVLDEDGLSLAEFLTAPPPDMSIVVRAALRTWIAPVFMQFHSFELRLEFEQSEYLR